MEKNKQSTQSDPLISKEKAIFNESESLLSAIFEAAIDFGILVIDEDGIITGWNSGAEHLFGYSRQEALGQHTDLIFTPEDRHARISMVEISTARSKGRSTDERWHLHKDGTRFFMSGVMTPLKGSNPSGFVKIARNITAWKLAEEALLVSEQRKSLAVKSAEMGEWEWDLGSNAVLISDQINQLMGLPEQQKQITPSDLLDRVFAADKDGVLNQLYKGLNDVNIFQTECRIMRADNSQIRWVNVYGRVVRHSTGQPSKMIGVVFDITSRKSLEKQKDDFISMASHELKTPLTSIKTFSELLMESLQDTGDTRNASLLGKLNTQVDRLISLIRNLLDTSVLDEGRMKLTLQQVDLNKLIEQHMDMVEAITRKHRLSWKPCPTPLLNADQERIMQVITNFVANAAKYSPVNSEIIVSTVDQGDSVMVTVQDQGPGIPPEAQQLIFERYYRLENTSREKGFGLGLYISAEIIKQHYGTIGVSCIPGQGSTFYFTLPYS